ncbi:hypothetical protein HMPREF3198_01206 [Winkia neuii]|nr:hypothetical protein HMPREF3198_01206 [Winkia neuii]
MGSGQAFGNAKGRGKVGVGRQLGAEGSLQEGRGRVAGRARIAGRTHRRVAQK